MKHKQLFFIFLLSFNFINAQIFNDGTLEYTITDGTNVSVKKYDNICPTGALTIPETVEDNGVIYTITNIGADAFRECLGLIDVKIPVSVKSIGRDSFAFSGLISLNIPDNVISIGEAAFKECISLTSVIIPNSIIALEDNVFVFCSNLKDVTIPASVTSLGNFTFAYTGLTSIVIPANVTSIGESTFDNCKSLTNVAVNWATPLVINENVFNNVAIENISLTVPTNTKALYETVAVWQDFGFIINSSVFNDGTLEYTITDNVNVSVKKYNNICPTGALTIPVTVENNGVTYTITNIGDNAFNYCSGLTSVIIPNSIISIGQSAFKECISLTSVIIPNSVTNIKSEAFSICTSLTTIDLPSSLSSIGSSAFEFSGLTSITIPTAITSIENNTFNFCQDLISITIPDSITSIGIQAFSFTGLTSVTIPNSVTNIGQSAFANCESLTSIIIPNSILALESGVFGFCSNLTDVIIPNSVTSIGDFAFGQSGLTSIDIPASVTSIGELVFDDCKNLTNVAVNWATPLAINSNIFRDVVIENIPLTVPLNTMALYETAEVWQDFGSITELDPSVFNDGILEYTITDGNNVSVKKYNNICPTGVLNIKETIENNGIIYTITNISADAFSVCSDLTSVTIPNTVISIGEFAFFNCRNLTNINIPNGLTIIENNTFSFCSSLTNVTIPNTVTVLEKEAFAFCTNFNSIIIPESVTSIKQSTFQGCTSVTNLTIPNSVTNIEESAFQQCSSLTNVAVNWSTPLGINANVFRDVTIQNITLTVPSGTEALYAAAAVWQDFGSIVLSAADFNNSIEVGLYPNPVKSHLKIVLEEGLQLKNINIYNSLGQFIKSSKTLTTNTSNLSSGIYLLEVTTNKGKAIKKFIIE